MAGIITVFGSFNVDLSGRADRMPKPAETVIGHSFSMGAGGKGSNQAVAAHRAGADVRIVTKVGTDMFSNVAFDFYNAEGMDASLVFVDEEVPTGIALIMVNEKSGQNQILAAAGACMNFTDSDVEKAKSTIERSSIVLVQMEVNLDANWKVIDIAKKAGATVVLNPAPAGEIPDEIMAKVDIITPNEIEAGEISGIEIKTYDDASRAAQVLVEKGVGEVIITLGEMGAYIKSGSRQEVIRRLDVDALDTTGAGDAFNGGLVAALAEGMDIFDAARFANIVGALSVTKQGAAQAAPFRNQIDQFIKKQWRNK